MIKIVDQIDARVFNKLGDVLTKLDIVKDMHATIMPIAGWYSSNAEDMSITMFDEMWIVAIETREGYYCEYGV